MSVSPSPRHKSPLKSPRRSPRDIAAAAAAAQPASPPPRAEPEPEHHAWILRLAIGRAHALPLIEDSSDDKTKRSRSNKDKGEKKEAEVPSPDKEKDKKSIIKKSAAQPDPLFFFWHVPLLQPREEAKGVVPLVDNTKDKDKDKGSDKSSARRDKPAPTIVLQHHVQTPLKEITQRNNVNFEVDVQQHGDETEFFLDSVTASPFPLSLYQYISSGKKKSKDSARKKKSVGDNGDSFGDYDPEDVTLLGRLLVDLSGFTRGATILQGWLPLDSAAQPSDTPLDVPSVWFKAELQAELPSLTDSNIMTLSIERLEQVPNWMWDEKECEPLEEKLPEQDAAAPASSTPAAEQPPPSSSRSARRDDDREKDREYESKWELGYVLPIGSAGREVRHAAFRCARPDAQSQHASPVGEWKLPTREVVVEVSDGGKKSGDKSARDSHGLSLPSSSRRPMSGRDEPETQVVQGKHREEIQRGAVVANHTRKCFLTASRVQAIIDNARHGHLLPLSFCFSRTPADDKFAELAFSVRATSLVDFRPLIKPGRTEWEAYYCVNQTTPPLKTEEKNKKKGAPTKKAGPQLWESADYPPETFDEAHCFVKVTVSFASPLIPVRPHLTLADVLPGFRAEAPAQPTLQTSFAQLQAPTFSSRFQGWIADEKEQIKLTRRSSLQIQSLKKDDFKVSDVKQELISIIQELLSQNPSLFNTSFTAADAGDFSLIPGASLPSSNFPSPTTCDEQLWSALRSAGLNTVWIQKLTPLIQHIIPQRFFQYSRTEPPQNFSLSHRQNQLYSELSQLIHQCLHEVLGLPKTAAASPQADFDSRRQKALYAELSQAYSLAEFHHKQRAIVCRDYLKFQSVAWMTPAHVVQCFYEFGAFYVRTAQLDLGEELIRQALDITPNHIPSLLLLSLILLEHDDPEPAGYYINLAHSLLPAHPLVSAILALYHDIAEEDEQMENAYYCATVQMKAELDKAGGQDALLNDMLIQANSGLCVGEFSLPLYFSQTIHLFLSRFLAIFHFPTLSTRILTALVDAQSHHIEQKKQSGSTQAFEYFEWGPFLEYASHQLKSANAASFNTTSIDDLLGQVIALVESTNVDDHHISSMLYCYSALGHCYYLLQRFDLSHTFYVQYLHLRHDSAYPYFDPLVYTRAAELYAWKQIRRESLSLYTQLVTTPLHANNSYYWADLSSIYCLLHEFQASEECIARASCLDDENPKVYGIQVMNELKKILYYNHHLNERGFHAHHVQTISNEQLGDIQQAFESFLRLDGQDVYLFVELGRLFSNFTNTLELSEACYSRALQIKSDPSIQQKLNWLVWNKRKQFGDENGKMTDALTERELENFEKEERAANLIQKIIRGAVARKQVKSKKRSEVFSQLNNQSQEEKQNEMSF